MMMLDGKYSVTRELSGGEGLTNYEATLPTGEVTRVDWFSVRDPKTRSLFHQYRTALKVLGSPLMIDAVIRPGVYYSAWWPSDAPSAEAYLVDHPRDLNFRQRLEELASTLAAYGFALRDATIVALTNSAAPEPAVAGLTMASRSVGEINSLNDEFLGKASRGGKRGRPARTTRRPVGGIPASQAPQRAPGAAANAAVRATTVDTAVRSGTIPVVKPRSGDATPRLGATRPGVRALLFTARVFPGIVMLAFAMLFGMQTVSAYLEPTLVRVPDVRGAKRADAVNVLRKTQLSVRASKPDGNDLSKAQDTVLSQDPPPGQWLHESRFVTLTINHPTFPKVPPLLGGLVLDDAMKALASSNLKVGRVLYAPAMPDQPDTDLARLDRVMGQFPPAGAAAPTSGTVDLLIAVNPTRSRTTFLPDLTGLDWKTAKGLVELAGLGVTGYGQRQSSSPPGTVIGQDPAPNTPVTVGGTTRLTLAVAQDAPAPSLPSAPTQTPVRPTRPEPVQLAPVTPATAPVAPTTATPQVTAPATSEPPAAGAALRDFTYMLPISTGPRVVEVRVVDAHGERVAYSRSTPGGMNLVVANIATWGNGDFSLFVDGLEIVEARTPFTAL